MKTHVLCLCAVLFAIAGISQPLSGTYTIGGSSPDYTTFTAAASALQTNGVSGPVVFNVRNGTYTESVYLRNISGSSPTNTITFQSESGDSSQVLLTYSGAANTFQWDTAHYATVRKISIRNTNIATQAALILGSHAHHFTVQNCFIQALNGSTGYAFSVLYPDSCIYVQNNRILNSIDGISIYGNPNFQPVEIVIENNNVIGGNHGISLGEILNARLRYNYIQGGSFGFRAESSSFSEFHHNIVRSNGGHAFAMLGCYGYGNQRFRIENNLIITVSSGQLTNYGVSITSSQSLEFVNNTIYFNSNYNYQAALYLNLIDSVFIHNNIIVNNGNGYATQFGGNVTVKYSDHNVMFTNGTLLSPGISTPTQWQSTYLIDYNSVFVNPQFVNIPNNFHPTNPLVDGIAITGNYGITDDLNGVARHPQYPDPGCYEFSIAPIANLGLDQTLCGTSLLLSAGNNGSYYVWSTGDTTQTIGVTASGSYWVQVTNLAGVDRDTINVTLNPFPTLTLSANVSICAGDTIQLVATSNATTFSWLPVAGLDNPSAAVVTANPGNSTTYTVSVTDANGCTTTDQVTVTVSPLPVALAGSDQSICVGSTIQIGTGSSSGCLWSPATGLSSTTDCQPIAAPVSTETYALLVTDAFGCTDTDTVLVTVNQLPIATACCSQVLCPGDTVNLNATSTASSFVWSPTGELSSATGASVNAFPSSTSTLFVTVTDSNGCSAVDSILLTVHPAHPVPFISQSGLDLMSSEANGNQWYLNGNILSGETGQFHTPLQNGNYAVVYTDSNGCTSTSTQYFFGSVNVRDPSSNEAHANYDQENQELILSGFIEDMYTVRVLNTAGQIVLEDNISLGETTIRFPVVLIPGLYLVALQSNNATTVLRFAIAK